MKNLVVVSVLMGAFVGQAYAAEGEAQMIDAQIARYQIMMNDMDRSIAWSPEASETKFEKVCKFVKHLNEIKPEVQAQPTPAI